MSDDTMTETASAIAETISEPLLVLERDLTVILANRAFLEAFSVSAEDTLGRAVYDLGNGQWNIPELRRLLSEILPMESEIKDYRVDHIFEALGRRVMMLNARRLDQPGQERVLIAITDVTETERLRNEIVGRAEFSEKVIDSVREALLVLRPDLVVDRANQSFYDLFCVDQTQAEGVKVYELGNGQWDIPELRKALEDILPRQNAFDDFEVRHDFPELGERVMLLNGRRLDHMNLILLAIRDVTEERRHAADQRVLVGELQHRVKNILANVNAIAGATLRSSADLAQFQEKFLSRLGSMARTQDMLMQRASGEVYLEQILRAEFSAHGVEDDGRLGLAGESVLLTRRQAQAVAMLVHELVTNAVKYGALSCPQGRIDVDWRLDRNPEGRVVNLLWRESGIAISPPSEKGYGSTVIEHSIRHMLDGHSDLEFASTGLVCAVRFPLRTSVGERGA